MEINGIDLLAQMPERFECSGTDNSVRDWTAKHGRCEAHSRRVSHCQASASQLFSSLNCGVLPMSSVAPARSVQLRPRSQAKLIFFVIFFALTAFVTYMKNAQIFVPTSFIAQHFAPGMVYLVPHAIFAGLAMVMGAFQFSNRLRSRYLKLHRVMGYMYVTAVFIGAPIAIPLAAKVDTPSLAAASSIQAFGWMLCTGIALYCVRTGNIQQHRRWMIRGYPFAMVFTVARVIIPIPAVFRTGIAGREIVVWSAIALAAFLPSVILEWNSIVPRRSPATRPAS